MALHDASGDDIGPFEEYDYPVERIAVGDAKMAYVDVPGDGEETFLCLHGEPTWGYLYRKLIPGLTARGRVVVPDAIGFGRSDKYTDRSEYSFQMHYDAFETFITELDLQNITLVCQDWGGILGLTLAANHPDRFARLVPMNTGIPTGTQEMPDAWEEFRDFVERTDDLPLDMLIQNATVTELSEETLAAYEAPYSRPELKAGARAWPDMVPRKNGGDGAEMTRAAAERLGEWEKPAFVLFSDSDPITHDNRDSLREHFPTASDQPDIWIEGGGHFLQEDAGEVIAERIVEFVDRT
ncbi:MAG: haloalkane dehalogenase [Halobacteriales archaeon]|nr:haloalkane dehalogenase [Halobacteriales archaeon]